MSYTSRETSASTELQVSYQTLQEKNPWSLPCPSNKRIAKSGYNIDHNVFSLYESRYS